MSADQFHQFARRMVAGLAIFAAFGVLSLVLQAVQIARVTNNAGHIDELRIKGDAAARRIDRITKAQVKQNARGVKKTKGKVKRLTRIVIGTPGKPGIGVKGGRGASGPVGPRGASGPQGVARNGATGSPGAAGVDGTDGTGKDGSDGVAGKDGDQGLQGDAGATGPVGPEPVSFTFVVGATTYTCTDPELDGAYECAASP